MQPHRNRVSRTTRQRQPIPHPPLRINILNRIESLQQSHNHIASLRQRKLLSNTDSWSTIERNVIPTRLLLQPPLRPELLRIRTPDVFSPMQEVHVVANGLALAHVYGLHTVGTAAAGDGGVADGGAAVHRDDGVETESFVEEVLEVLAGFEAGKGDGLRAVVGAEGVDDGLAEFLEDGWVAGEEERAPAEEGGGGVTTGEEDVEELGAEFDGILGGRGQSVQEDVGAVVLFFVKATILLALHNIQSRLDETVDKGVDLLVCALGFFVVGQEVQFLKPGPLRTEPLRLVEVVRKLVIHIVRHGCHLTVDALTKQEFRSRVDSQTKEDSLNIGVAGPTTFLINRKSLHRILNMTFLQIQLANLIPRELRPQQTSRSRPSFPVSGKLFHQSASQA